MLQRLQKSTNSDQVYMWVYSMDIGQTWKVGRAGRVKKSFVNLGQKTLVGPPPLPPTLVFRYKYKGGGLLEGGVWVTSEGWNIGTRLCIELNSDLRISCIFCAPCTSSSCTMHHCSSGCSLPHARNIINLKFSLHRKVDTHFVCAAHQV